ncbi:hypothetical protein B0H17DRAFT_1332496 [Mycena rosella]|uniref:F-box domain-containing protein n=1 Tax=Mycena rosella TaxID=1033263 RepID=A0AAD7DB66_MYCRO|nr:hypothetical protein B0H17DRAFT_1332496 [Mycena rosella]
MVLTRRAHKAILQWLPNETITEIVQAAPRSDQASLCRVSKLFRDLCLLILYRVVGLEADASVADFGDTVLSNAALAGLVRSYSVHFPRAGMAHVERFSQVLVDSSKALVRLEALSIHHMLLTDTHLEMLLRWTFPHLVRCRLGTASSHWNDTEEQDTLASFLIRHPGLENLHIQHIPYALERSSTSVRIPLPRLQQLRCPPRIIPSIVALRLKRVQLYWNNDDLDEVENTFVALKAMTASDVVDSVSRNLPHTRTLQLQSDYPPLHEAIGHLKNCLPRFTGLAFLSVHPMSRVLYVREGGVSEEINVLSDACPTLEACRLRRRAFRKVDGMWETCCLDVFNELAGLSGTI